MTKNLAPDNVLSRDEDKAERPGFRNAPNVRSKAELARKKAAKKRKKKAKR